MITITLAALLLAMSGGPAGEPVAPGTDGPSIQPILAAMKQAREQLRSGCFRARGRLVKADRADPDRVEKLEGDVEIFSAFDLDRGLIRFDRKEPVFRRVPKLDGAAGRDRFLDQEVGEYIRTPELAMTWINPWRFNDTGRSTAVGIYAKDIKPPPMVSPIDVSAVGLYLWEDFKAGSSYEKTRNKWTQDRWTTARPEPDGVVRLDLDRATSGGYDGLSLWVDERRGHSPTRLASGDRVGAGPSSLPSFESRTTWVQVDGVWVPSTYHMERKESDGIVESYDLSFEWISVNRGVEPGLLTAEGLDAPDGTPIRDYRGKAPVPVGNITRPIRPAPLPR
jgi:hypothetical protein